MVSRESPVTLVNLRPSSDRYAMPVVFIGPRVSKARGWKMWEDGRDEYFVIIINLNTLGSIDPKGCHKAGMAIGLDSQCKRNRARAQN